MARTSDLDLVEVTSVAKDQIKFDNWSFNPYSIT